MTRPRRQVSVEAIARGADATAGRVRISGIDEPIEVERTDGSGYRVLLGGRRIEVVIAREPGVDWGWANGRAFRWTRAAEVADRDPEPAGDTGIIRAPMPAVVTAVAAAPGQTVARGDTLLVLEAMKMELPLKAPRDGRVTTVRCGAGDRVDADAPLMELDDRATAQEGHAG